MTASWIDRLGPLSVPDVAERLGLTPLPGRSWSPCGHCGAEQRGSSDRRGPIGVRADGRGWRCHRCAVSGDGLALVALVLTGSTRPLDWSPVRAWLEGRAMIPDRPLPARAAPPPAPPRRPPLAEVTALWGASSGVTTDPEVAAWLRSRGLDPAAVEDLDLARAIPRGPLPGWARSASGTWAESGHRLLVPLVDHAGVTRSLRARAVGEARIKALAPRGAEVRGLVFADPLARRVLAGDAGARELLLLVGLVVVEGEPDWLSWTSAYGTDQGLERAPAVIGIESGSWTAELAARIPDGTQVRIRTHIDETGDRYGQAVVLTLGARCPVARLMHEERTA